MKVRATKRGYDNVVLREEGDEFDMPDGAKGSWFVPVGKAPKGKNASAEQADASADDAKVDASKLA